MDIDLLRAFCQLAKDSNYTLAAEHLYITQSALTKKIKRLESQIGVELFERGRNGAQLTQAGSTLLSEAQQLTERFSDFERLAKCVAEGEQGHLNIGFGISTYRQAPDWISQFKQMYPKVHITLDDTPSSKQIDALLSGELHLSFNRIQNLPSPLNSLRLYSDQLAVAVNTNQKIDRKEILGSLSGVNYLQLRPSRGRGLFNQIQRYLVASKHPLTVTQEASDILTLLALISANQGFAIIPLSAHTICPDNVQLIEIKQQDTSWDVGLIWNDDKEDRIRDRFIDMVKQKR
ncbi:LysR family transcriptional regulator [Vibrio nigripulchritudo]|uniref:LysR family transcriptional regulator n=1 Tax=Vibrio nigripulchritudo TaxID=28173 RepID=UPI0005FA4068|nr:LysR family transcriptional regulator [Vibrio nigripulchritudo]KJY79524.1 LysR family transcriptional regulator [Vibrio nigripulchritudo]